MTTPLPEITCHMGSHSVTCHPAVVTFSPLPQPKLVVDLATLEGCKAELIWVKGGKVTTAGWQVALWGYLGVWSAICAISFLIVVTLVTHSDEFCFISFHMVLLEPPVTILTLLHSGVAFSEWLCPLTFLQLEHQLYLCLYSAFSYIMSAANIHTVYIINHDYISVVCFFWKRIL